MSWVVEFTYYTVGIYLTEDAWLIVKGIYEGWHFTHTWKADHSRIEPVKPTELRYCFIAVHVPSQESDYSCICVLFVFFSICFFFRFYKWIVELCRQFSICCLSIYFTDTVYCVLSYGTDTTNSKDLTINHQ